MTAKSEKERDDWVKGLRSLTHDTINASYPVRMERWLWKEFYRMTSEKENVNVKDIRAFLPQVNCQIPKTRLQEIFSEVNNRSVGELSFDEFASLCNILTYDEKVKCWNSVMHNIFAYFLTRQVAFLLCRFSIPSFPNILPKKIRSLFQTSRHSLRNRVTAKPLRTAIYW